MKGITHQLLWVQRIQLHIDLNSVLTWSKTEPLLWLTSQNSLILCQPCNPQQTNKLLECHWICWQGPGGHIHAAHKRKQKSKLQSTMKPDQMKPETIRRNQNVAQTRLARSNLAWESKDRRKHRNRQKQTSTAANFPKVLVDHPSSSFSWSLSPVGNERNTC